MNKALRFLNLIDNNGFEIGNGEARINWFTVVTFVVILKGIAFPSWVSCIELGMVLAFKAYRWTFEPKVIERASVEDIENLKQRIDSLKGEVASVKMTFGLDPKRRLSVFQSGKG